MYQSRLTQGQLAAKGRSGATQEKLVKNVEELEETRRRLAATERRQKKSTEAGKNSRRQNLVDFSGMQRCLARAGLPVFGAERGLLGATHEELAETQRQLAAKGRLEAAQKSAETREKSVQPRAPVFIPKQIENAGWFPESC
jgi:cation transport regulator ChaC